MNYKDTFQTLISENRLEDARILLDENKAFAYDDSFYFANMGWVLNHIGNYQEAIPYLQKGMHNFPEDAWIYTQLGYSYNHIGNCKEALHYLVKGLEMGHDEPWVHGEIGWAYRESNDLDKAIEYFENSLLDEPDSVWVLAQAAFTYRDKGDKKSAEEYLKKVYLLSPDDDSIYDLVNFYKSEMRFQEEVEMLDKMEDNESFLWRDFEKAYAYNRLNLQDKAKDLLLSCIASGRDDTGVREELGDAYDAMQDKEKALEQYQIAMGYYEKALERNKDDAQWILQDMIYNAHKQEDMVLKLKCLDQLKKISPKDTWMLYHYAKAYANLNEFDKVISYCDECIQIEDDSDEVSTLKAWALGKQGKYKEAIALLHKIQENGRTDCWLFNELGWDYSEIEDHEEAIVYYEKSLRLDEHDPWVLSQVAWNKGILKDFDEALQYFKKSEENGRKDGWIYANFGWVYQNLLRYEKAKEYFDKAEAQGYKEEWFLNRKKEVEEVLEKKV